MSAQQFGFGPCAEMVNIAKGLRRRENFNDANIFFWNSFELRAIYDRSQQLGTVLDNKRGQSLFEYMDHTNQQFDAIISSYDAEPIFYGWYHDTPCFLYDGMFSFWDVTKIEKDIRAMIRDFIDLKEQRDSDGLFRLYQELTKENHHYTIFIAYFLSNHNFARKGDNDSQILSTFKELSGKTDIVGAIVPQKEEGVSKDHVFVSLSASLVPTVKTRDSVNYAKNVIRYVVDISKDHPMVPFRISINPKLFQILAEEGFLSGLPTNVEVMKSLSYEQNQDYIKRAKVLMISPGYSTLHEAANYGVPTVFLPEQNGGQPVGYRKLIDGNFPQTPNLTLVQNMDYRIPNKGFDDFPMQDLYSASHEIFNSDAFQEPRNGVKAHINELLNNPHLIENLGSSQRNAIKQIIGGFNGVEVITRKISNSLQRQWNK